MASPAQLLPPEVVDFIVDGNHGDKKTLSSCSLVCKAWLQSSRYCLFSDFDVYVGPNVGASFLKLLNHPLCTIIYCIRSISIYPGVPDQHGVASLGETTITGLTKLKHVSSLRIHNHRGRILKPTLDLLASHFNEVTSLRMSNPFPSFNDAIEFIAMFPLLKSIDFYPWCIDATPTTSPGICLPSTLRSLHLHSPFKHGSWFTEHCAGLQSLKLSSIKPADITTIKEVLDAFGSDLVHLSIGFPEGSSWPPGSDQHQSARDFSAKINYLCNPRLSSLEIKNCGDPSLDFLATMLAGMRTPNLEVLTWETAGLDPHLNDWTKVDARITDRAAFKRLKRLNFITHARDVRLVTPVILEPIRNRLPKAEILGIVVTGN
ncbi:hypothetical protein DFH09DRAFT_1450925 [Mycena vulgaris]|nr:hypothetical protein DFH09DRAFT_1450925 [Mycena vulgaris]